MSVTAPHMLPDSTIVNGCGKFCAAATNATAMGSQSLGSMLVKIALDFSRCCITSGNVTAALPRECRSPDDASPRT